MLLKILVILLSTTLTWTVSACSKTLRWSDDPPFSFLPSDQAAAPSGIHIDVVREILETMNCRLTLTKMPWARALEALKTGTIDMVDGAYRTKERESFALFSFTGTQSPNRLYLRKNTFERDQLSNLADFTQSGRQLGVQIGVSYSHEFDQLMKNSEFRARTIAVGERQSLWKMLARGRIDGLIADELTARSELKSLKLTWKIVQSDLIVSNAPAFFAFSKATTSPDFVETFSERLQAMQADGRYDAIIENHLD